MYIANNSKLTIFWRTFGPRDTVHSAGLGHGTLKPGDYTCWWIGSKEDQVQLEIRKKNRSGDFIQEATQKKLYKMEDEVSVTTGRVVEVSYEVIP
jgi:hypothetical protein